MSDIIKGLPVRTEGDVDARVQVKVVDATAPDTQQMIVDTDGNAHAEMHGNDPAGNDKVLRTSEQGHASVDGEYDATNNTDPSNIGILAHSRSASPADTQQTERLTSIQNGAGDTRALDVALHDESGEAYSATNPIPVSVVSAESGTDVADYLVSSAVAGGASVNHDYVVTAGKTLTIDAVECTASGEAKFELQVETGVATGIFSTKLVGFSYPSASNVSLTAYRRIRVAAGITVRIIRTNRNVLAAQDLYSTILGIEV